MWNRTKYLIELSVAPVYFLVVFAASLKYAFKMTRAEVHRAIQATRRKYNIIPGPDRSKVEKRMRNMEN